MNRKERRTSAYILIGVLIVAAIVRFYQIDRPFIDATSWRQSDTATIADNFYQGNWNIFYPEISWNGPGHNYVGYEFQTITYITALLYRVFGQHDWVARSVAVIFGLWGIFAFYQLVRRLWSEHHALVSAAIMAVLPGAIYVDQSFLPDPVMLSLTVTSVWLLVAYLQTERLHYLLLASFVGMLGFLTKISGLIVGIPMLYAVLAILHQKQKLRSKQLALVGAAAVVTLMPVVAYYLWAIHVSQTYPPYYIAAGEYWVWKFGLSRFLEQHYFLPRLATQLSWFWTQPLTVLVIIGLFLRPPRPQPDQPFRSRGEAPWLFHGWMLAFALYYLIAAQGLVNNPTNFNIANPAAVALAANVLMTIASLIQHKAGRTASLALIVAVVLIVAGVGHRKLEGFALKPWADNDYKLGLALRQVSQPEDLVVTATSNTGDTVAVYYSQRRGWIFPPAYAWPSLPSLKVNDSEAVRLLKELADKGANWFGIANGQKQQLAKDNPQFMAYVQQTLERYQESPQFTIYRIPAQK